MIERKLQKFIILFYLFCCVYSIFVALLQSLIDKSFSTLSLFEFIVFNLFNYITKFIFIIIAIIITQKYIINKISIFWSILIHTTFSILLTLYSSIIILSYEKYILKYDTIINISSLFGRFTYGSNFNFFVYFTLITILYAYYYFEKQQRQELKHSKLRAQLLDSKLKALQSQILPHFLFNSLNDISSLIETDVERSQDAIVDLSDLLRMTLRLKDTKLYSLKEELIILNKYISIEKLRFDEKISFKLDIKNEVLKYSVPPLILQPIVENSIKHGFSYNHDVLNILISIIEEKDWLVFYIENDGEPLKNKGINYGNGITNVVERMDTLYDRNYTFKMENNPKGGVFTIIKIPLSKDQFLTMDN